MDDLISILRMRGLPIIGSEFLFFFLKKKKQTKKKKLTRDLTDRVLKNQEFERHTTAALGSFNLCHDHLVLLRYQIWQPGDGHYLEGETKSWWQLHLDLVKCCIPWGVCRYLIQ
jgi:hypothetical protein